MAKKIYIGVSDKARKVNKMYVGVDGKARKIKKGYVGVGGVARPIFSMEGIEYYGTITDLQYARKAIAATHNNNYALFAGGSGKTTTSSYTYCDAYDANLTRSTATKLGKSTKFAAATHIGEYALFAGGAYAASDNGDTGNSSNTSGYAYNGSLSMSSITLSSSAAYMAATHNKNYALFGGGRYMTKNSFNYTYRNVVNAYNTSLTRTTPTALATARAELTATNIGVYALFAGGYYEDEDEDGEEISVTTNVIEAYNGSLTQSTSTTSSVSASDAYSGSNSTYAIIAFSKREDRMVNAFNSSLTRSIPASLTVKRDGIAVADCDKYVIFGGGSQVVYSTTCATVEAYDTSLTQIILQDLSVARTSHGATCIGGYALFAGGAPSGNSTLYKTVEAYKIS